MAHALSPRSTIDLRRATPMEALAGAYAERLALLRAGASEDELRANAEMVGTLERECRRSAARTRRHPLRDPATYLG